MWIVHCVVHLSRRDLRVPHAAALLGCDDATGAFEMVVRATRASVSRGRNTVYRKRSVRAVVLRDGRRVREWKLRAEGVSLPAVRGNQNSLPLPRAYCV